MGRLIDADICLKKAWQNFYKQEDEHEKNIDDYDILRDRFYEQSGFECCQQTIVNEQPVEAIPKADYENRLKADMVAMLEDLDLQIDELSFSDEEPINITQDYIDELRSWEYGKNGCKKLIQQKINSLKGE